MDSIKNALAAVKGFFTHINEGGKASMYIIYSCMGFTALCIGYGIYQLVASCLE